MKKLKEGFYHLKSKREKKPVLVHGYYCTDLDGVFVYGFNIHDGGGLLLHSDLSKDTEVIPVELNKTKCMMISCPECGTRIRT